MLVQRCEGEVRDKAILSDPSRVGVAKRNMKYAGLQTQVNDAQRK